MSDNSNPLETRKRRSILRPLLLIIGPIAVLAGVGYAYLTGGRIVSIDNAYVKADTITLSTDVSGMVAEVSVRNNQQVAQGQTLFRLDDETFRITLANIEAQLDQVKNDVEVMKANYRQKQEDIRQTQVDIAFYDKEYRRQQDLAGRSFASQQALDASRHNLDSARQQMASLNQQLAALAANLNGDPNIAAEQHPRYRQLQAQRDQAARDLRHTEVKAPVAGIVTNVDHLQPGQYLAAGGAAFSLVATDHVWIEANPKETDLTYVKPGDPVTVEVDTYPGVDWRGTIDSLSPASGAEFALLPAQNSSGNWVKVVQRIPIRVRVDDLAGKPLLRAGMSTVVDIDTGHKRDLATLIGSVTGKK